MGKLGLALLVFSIFSFTSQLSVGAETKPSPVWVKDFDVEISDIAISADGKFIAVGAGNKVLLFDNLGNLLWTKSLQGGNVGVAVSGNGEYIAARSLTPRFIYLYNNSGELVFSRSLGGYWVNPPDGLCEVATYRWEVTVAAFGKVYNGRGTSEGYYCYSSYVMVGGRLEDQSFCDSSFSTSGTGESYVGCHENIVKGKEEDYGLASECKAISISADGKYFVAGAKNGDIYFFEYPKKLLKRYSTGSEVHRVLIKEVNRSNSSYTVVALNREGFLYFFDEEGNLRDRYLATSSDAMISSIGSYVKIEETWGNKRLGYYETEVAQKILKNQSLQVVVVANSIDYGLAMDFLEYLRGEGISVILSSSRSDLEDHDFIIILGGPEAYEGVGGIVKEVLNEAEQGELRVGGASNMYIKADVWRAGQIVMVLAGSDRHRTQKAWRENKQDVTSLIQGR